MKGLKRIFSATPDPFLKAQFPLNFLLPFPNFFSYLSSLKIFVSADGC